VRNPMPRIFGAGVLVLALGLGMIACGPASTPARSPDSDPAAEAAPAVPDPRPVPPAADEPPPVLDASAADEAAARAIVEAKCARCHGADRVWNETADAAEWNAILDRMAGLGATLEPQERETLLRYLLSR